MTTDDCTGITCVVSGVRDAVTGAVDAVTGTVDAARGAVETVAGVADFWSDPWGNTFLSLQSAAHGLAETVLPALSRATLPDLTAQWFLSAYGVSFALAVFLAVMLLIPQFVRTAQGRQSGRELSESVAIYFPMFLAGAMFGPMFGVVLVNFFASLTEVFTSWGVSGSADEITTSMTAMLAAEDASGLAGGAVIGVLFMLGMIAGLLLVVLQLVVQLVTLYFTGALLPLGLVWIIDSRRRDTGWRIILIWLGILASHPLLFFLLGITYRMTSANITVFSDTPTLQATVQLIVSLLALLMAGLSPFILLKLAPVLPIGTPASGPSLAAPVGAQNMNEAAGRYGSPARDGGDDTTGGPGPATEPLTRGAGEAQDGAPAPVAARAAESAQDDAMGAGALDTVSPGVVVGDGTGAPASAAGTRAAAGTSTAAAGATGAAGAMGAGDVAAGAADEVAAAGAAESSTGAGAVIGVPTLIAAGAAKAYQGVTALNDATADAVTTEAESYGAGSTTDE